MSTEVTTDRPAAGSTPLPGAANEYEFRFLDAQALQVGFGIGSVLIDRSEAIYTRVAAFSWRKTVEGHEAGHFTSFELGAKEYSVLLREEPGR